MLKAKLRDFWYKLSPANRFRVRRLYYLPIDICDKLTGKSIPGVPPRGIIYTGRPCSPKQFVQEGEEQAALLQKHINLQLNDYVLDIGSGIGRTALALSKFLNTQGRYEGFDVVELGVKWCNNKIKPLHPSFNFTYVPLHNDLYNDSSVSANQFRFPYADDSFTKVFNFSVFTHMQVQEIQQYMHEIARVLKPGGLCLSTFFLYDAQTESVLTQEKYFSFPFKKEGYSLMSETTKSGNIAIEIPFLKNMITNAGLELISIVDGFWKDYAIKKHNPEYQDMVVVRRPVN